MIADLALLAITALAAAWRWHVRHQERRFLLMRLALITREGC